MPVGTDVATTRNDLSAKLRSIPPSTERHCLLPGAQFLRATLEQQVGRVFCPAQQISTEFLALKSNLVVAPEDLRDQMTTPEINVCAPTTGLE